MIMLKGIVASGLLKALEEGISKGTLHLVTPTGERRTFRGAQSGAEAQWQIHDWSVAAALAIRGDIGLGQTYAAGLWDADDLYALFRVFVDNLETLDAHANGHGVSQLWYRLVNSVLRRNSLKGSRKNIRSHYDVGNAFYRLWLDDSLTYSSAFYVDAEMSLEEAQQAKYRRILDAITPDRRRVLEIGCGWGGFALAASNAGHALTGLTISPSQHQVASERLAGKADIRLEDYRHVKGMFEAIASIEMFEAVGRRYWPAYFNTLRRRLVPGGIAVVQTITVANGVFDTYARRSDYIRHYVFPGGMLPSVAAFRMGAEKAGLVCKEVFAFGSDYTRTLREWLVRFDAALPKIKSMGYGESFIRSWRLYLSMCAASFAAQRTDVVQVVLENP